MAEVYERALGGVIGLISGGIVDAVLASISQELGVPPLMVGVPLIFTFIGIFHEEVADLLGRAR